MATPPRISNLVQVTPFVGHIPGGGGTPTPAGSVAVTGTADPGATILLNDRLNGAAFLGSTTSREDGTWLLDLGGGFSGFGALSAGLHSLVATSYPSGLSGPQGLSSAPVEASVGTPGPDTLTGQVLSSSGIAGPRFIFGGPGDDMITAYTVVPDAAGRHASDAAVTVDAGRERDGSGGLDTVILPVSLRMVLSHYYSFSQFDFTTHLVLNTSDARVDLANVERLHFDDVHLTVQSDGLVDYLYYDQRYPDLAAADVSARAHYDQYGWREGRDPDALFSTRGYLGAYRDVRAAGVNPLNHYDQTGWREGRNPSALFDTTLYLRLNPDVAAAGLDPLKHYLANGMAEGRRSAPAVGSAVVQDAFDPLYYALANADVSLSGIDPLSHWQQYGSHEGRNPNGFFDTGYYLSNNPDVAASGMNPLEHYNRFGWHEGRDPSTHFGTGSYLAANPDVAAAGINPLQHFLQYGAAEGRSGFGDIL